MSQKTHVCGMTFMAKLEHKEVVQPLPELLPVAFDVHGQTIFPKELSHSSSFKGTP